MVCACFTAKAQAQEPSHREPAPAEAASKSKREELDQPSTAASTSPSEDEVLVRQENKPTPVKLDSLNGSGVLVLGPEDYVSTLQGPLPPGFTVTDKNQRPIELFLNTNWEWKSGHMQMQGGDEDTQFNDKRLILLLKPGDYPDLTIEVGYYSHVAGLGATPADVSVKVGTSVWDSWGQHTNSFWRSIENLSVDGDMHWWVSQATSLRRIVVNGNLSLGGGGWCSGGFLANSVVTGGIEPNGQQQWCSRNTEVRGGWNGWPSIFNSQVGNTGSVDPSSQGFVSAAPIIAEKPFLAYENGQVVIHIPPKRENATGPDHNQVSEKVVVFENMLISTEVASAEAINTKLKDQSEQNGWKALVILPGEYDKLDGTVIVDTSSNVVVIGLGFATFIGHEFGPCLRIVDNGKEVRTSGLLFHQGQGTNTQSLIQFAENPNGSSVRSSADPEQKIFFHDIFCRTGGPKTNLGTTDVMMQVDATGVVGDNSWLWTGDHGDADKNGHPYRDENGGKFVDWYANHGLIVEGADYVQYGLMSEHHKGHMSWFKGENAQIFFYQSELPYAEFDTSKYAYLVEPGVTTHNAVGIGAYVIFADYPLNPAEPDYAAGMSIPDASGIRVRDLIVVDFKGRGAQHALKVGDDYDGPVSTWGQMHFVSHNAAAQGRLAAQVLRDEPGIESTHVAHGVAWPWSIFCHAPSDVDA